MLMTAVAVCFVLCFAAVFSVCGSDTAYAALPESYLNDAYRNDWHFDADNLNINSLKGVVDGWKADDAFSFEKLLSDPVVIAVIDTGINADHELFDGVLLTDGDGKTVGRNTYSDNDDITDAGYDGHGTHVAGIVAALIRALDLEDYVKIMPIRAGYSEVKNGKEQNSFRLSDVIEAVDFALSNGADVVNMSFAATSTSWSSLVTQSDAQKAVFVAAAGNDGKNVRTYPAASDNVIGVMNYGMSGGEKTMRESSNFGSFFDVCAPGTDIFSANAATVNGYKNMTGTSMASPVTAFTVGLLEVRYRASGVLGDFTATKAYDAFTSYMVECPTLTAYQTEFPVLDALGLVTEDFVIDANGNVQLAPEELKAEISLSELVFGETNRVELSATLVPSDDYEGLVYEWHYVLDGLAYTVYGKRLVMSWTPHSLQSVTVTVSVYGAMTDSTPLLTSETQVLSVTYAEFETSWKIVSETEITDGACNTVKGETVVFGFENSAALNPDAEAVWYVDGQAVHRGREFRFAPDKKGTYLISYSVDGTMSDSTVTVNVEAVDKEKLYKGLEITGYVLLGIVVAGGIAAAVAAKKKKQRGDADGWKEKER